MFTGYLSNFWDYHSIICSFKTERKTYPWMEQPELQRCRTNTYQLLKKSLFILFQLFSFWEAFLFEMLLSKFAVLPSFIILKLCHLLARICCLSWLKYVQEQKTFCESISSMMEVTWNHIKSAFLTISAKFIFSFGEVCLVRVGCFFLRNHMNINFLECTYLKNLWPKWILEERNCTRFTEKTLIDVKIISTFEHHHT